MTCDETRAALSALLDEALDAAERAACEAHLAGCPECRRELDRLRQTVGLLRALPAPAMPAGFAERALAAARAAEPGAAPRRAGSGGEALPRRRRLARAVFFPLQVKLPIEAAAVLLVAVAAVYVFERTPELQQATRVETPASPAPSPPTSVPPPSGGPPESGARPRSAPALAHPAPTPAAETPARTDVPAPATPASPRAAERPAATTPRALADAPPASTPAEAHQPPPAAVEEDRARRRGVAPAPAAKSPAAPLEKKADAAGGAEKAEQIEPVRQLPPGADLQTPRVQPMPAPPAGPPVAAAPAPRPAPPSKEEAGGRAASEPKDARGPSSMQAARPAAPALGQLAPSGRLAGRLGVSDPAEALRALAALLAEIGGREVGRRAEGAETALDIDLPAGAHARFVQGVARIGHWRAAEEAPVPEGPLRVELRLVRP